MVIVIQLLNLDLKKEERTLDEYVYRVLDAIDKAAKHESYFDENKQFIAGLTSNKIKHFLNNLCSYNNSIYLELGVYTGATFYAATENNPIRAMAVDNWSNADIKPMREEIFFPTIKDPRKDFLSKFINPRWSFVEKDIRSLTPKDICDKPNIIFYDAGHEYWEQYENLDAVINLFADKFILILDEANFNGVVTSIEEIIKKHNLKLIWQRKILTSIPEDEKDWWNGLQILVLEK